MTIDMVTSRDLDAHRTERRKAEIPQGNINESPVNMIHINLCVVFCQHQDRQYTHSKPNTKHIINRDC